MKKSQLIKLISNLVTETLSREKEREREIKFRFDECTLHTLLSESKYKCNVLMEAGDPILRKKNWEVNNYHRFLDIVKSTPSDKKGFLTWHGLDEIQGDDWVTYTLKGHDVAFALHYINDGQIDICNLVNNSELKGIGSSVLEFAKMMGGTQMDNYRGVNADGTDNNGFLGDKYRKAGFDRQTWRDKFNPEYQPLEKEWQFNTEKYGTPDVEGLELSKHRMKYNQPNNNYKEKFNKRVNKQFNR